MSRPKGGKLSVTHRENIARSLIGKNKGKKHSEAFIQNCRARNLGTKRSTVTKQKMKESNSKYWLGKKRLDMVGDKNPMHTHPNSYKSKFGKCGYRQDIGIFVRSRWEANVYRIYKYLGYKIEYEPKSFKLSDGRTYRPDFYIKELNLWIEVKGCWLKDAKSRFDLFQLDYPEINIQVIDPLKYKELLQTYSSKINMEG